MTHPITKHEVAVPRKAYVIMEPRFLKKCLWKTRSENDYKYKGILEIFIQKYAKAFPDQTGPETALQWFDWLQSKHASPDYCHGWAQHNSVCSLRKKEMLIQRSKGKWAFPLIKSQLSGVVLLAKNLLDRTVCLFAKMNWHQSTLAQTQTTGLGGTLSENVAEHVFYRYLKLWKYIKNDNEWS